MEPVFAGRKLLLGVLMTFENSKTQLTVIKIILMDDFTVHFNDIYNPLIS